MKLLYELSEDLQKRLDLQDEEEIWYAIPVDLSIRQSDKQAFDVYKTSWLIATNLRFAVLGDEENDAFYSYEDCKQIRLEHQVHSGIVIVTMNDESKQLAARCSMRHMVRVSYIVRGANLLVEGYKKHILPEKKIESHEYETYCETCGRALPGTSHCPYCAGKGDVFKKLFVLAKGFEGRFVQVSLLMLATSVVNLSLPMIQRNFIDHSLTNPDGNWRGLWIFALTMFCMLVIRGLVGSTRYWLSAKLGAELSMSIRTKLYFKIQSLSLSFINGRKPGELMNRVSRDTGQIRRFMEEVFGDMISVLLTMIASLVMMFMLNWQMTLLSLVFVVAVFVTTKMFWHHIHTIYHKQWLKNDELNSSLQDILSGMRIVKSFGQEERESARFQKKNLAFAEIVKKNETFWAIFFPFLTFLLGAGTYVAIYMGGMDVLSGKMSTGELVQFLTYSGYLYGPLGWMTHLPRSVMQMATSLNRIYDVLDEVPSMADHAESKSFEIKGKVELCDVTFGYQTYEPVLEHISLSVKPGEMIGLVGASGTGKSTLINLIMRLYDVDQGKILIDGVDMKNIKQECLHSQVGVVLQETFLFSGSILANIRFAKTDATLAEVIQAAKAANAHDFICKTPDGYNTYVGEHGYNLSGGERQRIAIARAILNNPRLLILDEATSALDTESEYLIQQALDRLVQGRTTFAIAHRLSTLRNADRLVVIDHHTIAEVGTHNELLEKKGIYYGLVNAQLKMAKGTQE